MCSLHWRPSRGDLKNAASMATVAGDLCLAPRIFTVRGAVIATFWRKAFASRMRAFLRGCHAGQTGNPRSNLRMRTVKARSASQPGTAAAARLFTRQAEFMVQSLINRYVSDEGILRHGSSTRPADVRRLLPGGDAARPGAQEVSVGRRKRLPHQRYGVCLHWWGRRFRLPTEFSPTDTGAGTSPRF